MVEGREMREKRGRERDIKVLIIFMGFLWKENVLNNNFRVVFENLYFI